MAQLLSVNVGLPQDIEWQGKTVHTAIWKTPVQGRRVARRLNIDGDGQGDTSVRAAQGEVELTTAREPEVNRPTPKWSPITLTVATRG